MTTDETRSLMSNPFLKLELLQSQRDNTFYVVEGNMSAVFDTVDEALDHYHARRAALAAQPNTNLEAATLIANRMEEIAGLIPYLNEDGKDAMLPGWSKANDVTDLVVKFYQRKAQRLRDTVINHKAT